MPKDKDDDSSKNNYEPWRSEALFLDETTVLRSRVAQLEAEVEFLREILRNVTAVD